MTAQPESRKLARQNHDRLDAIHTRVAAGFDRQVRVMDALIRRGVESALVTYPTRYTHSPIETVDEGDLRACVDLLVAFATAG